MTRKQAIMRVCEALDGMEKYKEATAILKDMSEELPLIHWSDKSIRDAVEQFIIDNGRVPTASDFRKKGMPPHTVIRQKYGITLAEWLFLNYPTDKASKSEERKKNTYDFIKEYNRLKPVSQDDFNKRRSVHIKSWQTIASYHFLTSWQSLLKELCLERYTKIHDNKLKVQIHIDNNLL